MKFRLFLAILAMVACQAAPQSSTPAGNPEEAKTEVLVRQSTLDAWIRLWQKRLSLSDWNIEASIVRIWELKPDTLGNLHWNAGTKKAVIRVLNPVDYDLPPAE